MTDDARKTWKRRVADLEAEDAKASDPAQRFRLGEQIREAKGKLAELNPGFCERDFKSTSPRRRPAHRKSAAMG